ncbi:MAG TPA: hypothetical protein VKT83_16130 [bacterium]|nr:hypothetical protein [bacterium]
MRTQALRMLVLSVAVVLVWSAGLPAFTAEPKLNQDVIRKLSAARLATAKYSTDLAQAKADGYTIITPMIPNMGYHFLNPKIAGFDVTKPPILVYVRRGDAWQLVAIEWVFPKKPAVPPLQGATYGSFGAACHYADGSFLPSFSEAMCAKKHPQTGAAFGFWHPPLVTFHVWLWYPNPNGVFGEYNPLLTPFNND